MKNKQYLNNDEFTSKVYEYNKKNNPIKFYNVAFDYYIDTYHEKPSFSENWNRVVDIKYEFEEKRINRSIKKYQSNEKIKEFKDIDVMKANRISELDSYFEVVRSFDPSEGKRHEITIPDDIGLNIYKMAEHYYTNFRFYGYTYIKEDLIMDATEQCFKYIGNFSIYSSSNAFSFFSSFIYHTFITNIKKYNKQIEVKAKMYKIFYNSDMSERDFYLEESIKGE